MLSKYNTLMSSRLLELKTETCLSRDMRIAYRDRPRQSPPGQHPGFRVAKCRRVTLGIRATAAQASSGLSVTLHLGQLDGGPLLASSVRCRMIVGS